MLQFHEVITAQVDVAPGDDVAWAANADWFDLIPRDPRRARAFEQECERLALRCAQAGAQGEVEVELERELEREALLAIVTGDPAAERLMLQLRRRNAGLWVIGAPTD